MQKVKNLLHHNSAANTNTGTTSNSMMHPFASQYNLPSNITSWQQGQPIPQGWRLGRKGYLKPAFVLPTHLSNWQKGQPLPEGYRMSKRGSLRPVNYFSWWSATYNTTSPMQTNTFVSSSNVLPAEVEIREKPAVVQEVIKGSVREEIQPVIHREREQLEIREEIQPVYEKSVRPTLVEERALAAEVRPEVRLGSMPVIAEGPRSSVFVEAEQRSAVMHAPIVEEVVHKKIIEEVQPVIHREVIAPRVINERKDIYEKIVEAPYVTYSTRPALVQETVTPVFAPTSNMADVTTVTTVTQETDFVPAGMARNTTTTTGTTGTDGKKHHFNFLHRNHGPNAVNKH